MTAIYSNQQDLKLQDILQCDSLPLALSLVNSRVSKHSLRLLDVTPKAFKLDDVSIEQLFNTSRYSFGEPRRLSLKPLTREQVQEFPLDEIHNYFGNGGNYESEIHSLSIKRQ